MADELTDLELRRELFELGAKTVGPITPTTRSIYVKKLNRLKVGDKKPYALSSKKKPGRKLVGFSSDESEGEGSAPEPVGRQFVSTRKEYSFGKNATNITAPLIPHVGLTRPSLRRTWDDTSSNNHRPTGSFSMQASFNSSGAQSGFGESDSRPRRSAALGRPAAARPDPHVFELSDSDADLEYDDLNGLDESDQGFASPEMASVSVNTSPRLDDSSLFNRTVGKIGAMWGSGGRGRQSTGRVGGNDFSLAGPSTGRSLFGESSVNNHDRTHTPVTTNHTTGQRQAAVSDITYLRERSANNILTSARHRQSPMLNNSNHISQNDKLADEETILKQGFKTKEDPSAYSLRQKIPLVLEVLFGIFFAVLTLALLYMSMNSGRTHVTDSCKDDWMICTESSTGVCYPYDLVVKAREVVLDVVEMLAVRSGDFECGRHTHRNMTDDEVHTRIESKYGQDVFYDEMGRNTYRTAIHLIYKNTQWKISMFNAQGELATMHENMRWMESQVPYHGFYCSAHYYAVVACYVSGVISIVTLFAVLCWWGARRQEDELQAVYRLEEQIIDILKAHHDKCQNNPHLQPFLAIPHIRDMIIPPKDRRQLQSRWDRAVKALSANESRIRVETKKIAGEEFAVWLWLQTSVSEKVWQGPAFGENRDSVKLFKFQCLKIRNMFDSDNECTDNWHINIEDAILEKVMAGEGGNSGIVHMVVDKTSREGCVYVKCSSPEAAGKAYRALHAWWFDSNLVTVKYLRLERYYERYPEAAHATVLLCPSNNQRRSLSQPFHHSIYESC